MDKTIKINLGGILFQIEEDAYYMLRDYLQAINNRFQNIPGGNETIEDIESRIAEIFQSQKNIAGVISRENVEAMMAILGKPADFEVPGNLNEPSQPGPIKRRLYRNPDDTVIGGVCGGLGAYLNNDPVWFRIVFIIFLACFGIGLFLYLILWIAIPSARTEFQKRELYGEQYHRRQTNSGNPYGTNISSGPGSAFSEIFNAIGKFFYIIFRIFMIMIGIVLVATGFTALFTVCLAFFFRNPEFISMGSLNSNLFFLHDFLNFIVDPSVSLWIIILSFIVLTLPLFAFIYWGIKMIFWFRARDGVISIILLVLWVISITALTIILVDEGVSFSKTGYSTSREQLDNKRDTLYIMTNRKVKDLHTRKEFAIPDNEYSMFISDPDGKLCIRTRLRLIVSQDRFVKIELRKSSMAVSKLDAVRKSETLDYNYRVASDTLLLDEYFTLPEGRKWSGDRTEIWLYIPENTILYFDNTSENMFPERIRILKVDKNMEILPDAENETQSWELGGKYWKLDSDGLTKAERRKSR